MIYFGRSVFEESSLKHYVSILERGLSVRGGGQGFPLDTMNMNPGYFHRKMEEK